MATEPTLHTSRLELWHLSVDDMKTLVAEPMSQVVWENKPFQNSFHVFVGDPGPLRWRIPQVLRDPATNKWFVRLIVEKETREIVGSISFHEPPNIDGTLEVGLEIVAERRRQGYAREALLAMWNWATEHPEVITLRYSVSIANEPSLSLIRALGFDQVGSQIDEIDGQEEIFEMTASEFRQRFGAN